MIYFLQQRSFHLGFIALLTVLIFVVPAIAADNAGYKNVPVAGTAMQLGQTDGRYFEQAFEHVGTMIKGLAFPYVMMCPGLLAIVDGGITCGDVTANGFQGMSVTREYAERRNVGKKGRTPTFTVSGRQMFSGWLVIKDQRYFGSMTLEISLSGRLNNPAGVDCFKEPNNMACGASDFGGTWQVVRGEGTEELRNLSGSGTLTWAGCTNPSDPTTCSFPEYQGTIDLLVEK